MFKNKVTSFFLGHGVDLDPIAENVSLYSSVDHKPGSQFSVIFVCFLSGRL